MFSEPTFTISEPRLFLSYWFSGLENGKHFLFLWFICSVDSLPWGTGLIGLRVSTPFAVGNQIYHQIGSSDSHEE